MRLMFQVQRINDALHLLIDLPIFQGPISRLEIEAEGQALFILVDAFA